MYYVTAYLVLLLAVLVSFFGVRRIVAYRRMKKQKLSFSQPKDKGDLAVDILIVVNAVLCMFFIVHNVLHVV
ncbi:hypothetical protein PP175_21800 [Aneurinibacillus sp. Ricciae_BoGa-3]|uniref:hypothetical protein n=1 Tax=Aneurinibacillus sp. Ricciae_BoGa-3 TaxID=3022697 RepID=UPI0023417C78|nr:hypothetical protein [Aneurinibacillus sp. Ricciae_BoGa-3]WCK53926.1 hypothetical protein PP175_21800 [Aneurinibacillus sp. Ricciae_BoGa-3]